MSMLGRTGGAASAIAKQKAEQMARSAARKAAAFVAVSALLTLALVFASIAGFVALEGEIGTISAALVVSGASLFLALAIAALSRSRPAPTRSVEDELRAEIDRVAERAREDIRQASPYLVAAAFVSGFFSGSRK